MDETPFDRLARELDGAARRQVAAAPQPRRRRRSLGLLGVAIALPALAATAWAASTLISSGAPVAYLDGAPVSGVGVGAPVPGSARMLTTTVPDPDGGLPWGLRSFRTTRGLVCLQVGRVYEGKLGVLGRDGSFGDDGRFHELRPGVVPSDDRCFPPDGAGTAFLTFHHGRTLQSGEPCMRRSCLVLMSAGGRPAAKPPPGSSARRSIDFGLLGPKATSITYRGDAGVKTMRPLGDEGGYLVVRRPLPPAPVPARYGRLARAGVVGDDYIPAMTPASRVILRVRYGDEGRCDVRPRTPFRTGRRTGGCPDPPGFVPIPQAEPADVRTKVTVTPVGVTALRVRFTARVAVRDRLSAYDVIVHPPRTAGRCCNATIGDATDRDISAGRTVVKDVGLLRRRPGRYRIVVSLRTQSPHPSPGGNLQYPGTLVGRASVVVR